MSNRLKLDWTINSTYDRKAFLDTYLTQITFVPNEEEIEMLGNYILWGKDIDGKSAVQRHEITIETRNKTWQKKEEESLDSLIESPTFNEASLFGTPKAKTIRNVFSRDEALNESPDFLRSIFEELFSQIDSLDLVINYYDLAHGKRTKPPREELLEKFSAADRKILQEKADSLNQFKYLKLRHELVELRRQQFTLRDSYRPQIQRTTPLLPNLNQQTTIWEDNCKVYPLGVISPGRLGRIFLGEDELVPDSFTEDDLAMVSRFYWKKKQEQRDKLFLDFTNEMHVAAIMQMYFELEESDLEEDLDSMTARLIRTLEYYIKLAKLTDAQREILQWKIDKKTNQQIAIYINKKYEKSYTINYISTIFRKKIIPTIIEAVEYHEEIVGNLFFKENFKRCTGCGRLLLMDKHNFIKKSRSKDGFSNKCKECEKLERERRKEKK